jgi:hypothetical protein
VTIVPKAVLMVPLPAIKARAKMHKVGFIWVVGPLADARDARVKLPSHVEWYNNRYARKIRTITEPKMELYSLRM